MSTATIDPPGSAGVRSRTPDRPTGTGRTARPRTYLMCRPTHFDVTYSINPWMRPERPTDGATALAQWQQLHDRLLELGHRVELIDPEPTLPDMVFAANGATVVDGLALPARFRHAERAGEQKPYTEWLRNNGFRVCEPVAVNEGEGDFLLVGDRVLAGTGFRSDAGSHAEVAALFGRPVIGLELVDARFYHLDTALAVLDDDQIMYYPGAFGAESRELLARLYPSAVLADEADAAVFGLNAISDGRHVLLTPKAHRLAAQLADRGFVPVPTDLSELLKAGGAAKCCVLELRRAAEPQAGAR